MHIYIIYNTNIILMLNIYYIYNIFIGCACTYGENL